MSLNGDFLNFIIFILSAQFSLISAFNIDTYAPILKNGPTGSYFGYQATFHINENGKTLILVGAPKDNLTNSHTISGSVYKCNYDSSPSCDQIDLDKALDKQDTNDIWLGGAIKSKVEKGGKAVFCAHRFKKNHWGEGQCFIMTSNLEYEIFSSPCGGAKPKQKGHEQFGVCQAGVSVDITKENDVLMGIPGAYSWRGAVVKRLLIVEMGDDDDEYMSLVAGKDEKVHPNAATRSDSYLGWSLSSGYLMPDPKRLTFVGGAPRSQDVGEVIFFTSEGASHSHTDLKTETYLTGSQFGSSFGFSTAVLDVNNDGYDDLVVGAPFYRDKWLGGAVYVYLNRPGKGVTPRYDPQVLTTGLLSKPECLKINCLNSQFGHTLANIGDVNMDGFQDLAVGAPYEGRGVVRIYKGGVDGLTLMQTIQQASFPKTFGISIQGGIDVDKNGYPDIIVGAYQSDQVLILRSRPIVKVKHFLNFLPSILDHSLTSCPTDNNPHNCLEVRVCFMLEANVKAPRQQVELEYRLEAELFANREHSRVFFKENSSSSEITKRIEVRAEKNCNKHQVLLHKNLRDFLNPIPFRLTYRLANPKNPSQTPNQAIPSFDDYPVLDHSASNQTHMVSFKKNCGEDGVCNSDLKLQATLSLNKIDGKEEGGMYRLRVGIEREAILEVEVSNAGEDAHECTLYLRLPNQIVYTGLNIEDSEITCDATQDPLVCSIDNPLPGKGARRRFGIRLNTEKATPSKQPVSIVLHVNTTSVEKDEKDDRVELKLEIKVETDLLIRGRSEPEGVFYSGEVKGESAVHWEEDIGSEVKHRYEIKNIGKAAVKSSTVLIWWPYELHSRHASGKHLLYLMDRVLVEGEGGEEGAGAECTYDSAIVNPLGVKTKKRFDPASSEGSLKSKPDYGAVRDGGADDDAVKEGGADDDVVKEGAGAARMRRSTEPKTAAISFTGSSVKKLDCEDDSAKCHVISCDLEELKQGHSIVIIIRSRLWNSTFLQEFQKYDRVEIHSKAQVTIDPSLNIEQTDTANDVLKIMTSVQPEFTESKGVAWWVVLLAVLVGVLLLLALIILLWKCGFFKRNRGSHMTSHKAEMLKKEYDDE